MQVFKFGGASLKDADGIKNVSNIIKNNNSKLLVVVSAMGKTTNNLERLTDAFYYKKQNVQEIYQDIKNQHLAIINNLFEGPFLEEVINNFEDLFVELDWFLEEEPHDNYDFVYDQIVCLGEFMSSCILSNYLNYISIKNICVDVRGYIKTDNRYREGNLDWKETEMAINKDISKMLDSNIVITQGFIGCTSENFTTTLGREGSDYTATIFGYCLDAEKITIWKDVNGVLNADPKRMPDAQNIGQLSYFDAIEMTYYGATVIHPKTIKPLQNKNIPLYVKSFINIDHNGTEISEKVVHNAVSSFIFKPDQILLSISPKDYSFIIEENLSSIFNIFHENKVKINSMQNSAMSFTVCVDNEKRRIDKLMTTLKENYKVKYNEDLELITIRNYTDESINQVISPEKQILLEVRSRHNLQYVIR